jgi:hypothetical protein
VQHGKRAVPEMDEQRVAPSRHVYYLKRRYALWPSKVLAVNVPACAPYPRLTLFTVI